MRIFLGLVIFAAACGPNTSGDDDDSDVDGMVTDDPCTGAEIRCVGTSYQVCQNDVFVEQENCDNVCDLELGCVDCAPSDPRVCVGDSVYACNEDGTVGELIEGCDLKQCHNGTCGDEACGAEGADIIYVVDDSYRLYSFDPELLPADPFRLIGNLNCPAAAALPGWPVPGAGTPFSMAVDRQAVAWVLYNSGELFHVSTQDASCEATSFQVAQQSGGTVFELFGMGFVSDEPGGGTDTLFVAGSLAANVGVNRGSLATIDTDTLQVNRVNALPNGTYSPELTGTGAAELYGYYPGAPASEVARINKTSAANDESWSLPAAEGDVRAWGFAHWGGLFYVFITTNDGISDVANVLEFNPETGQAPAVLTNTGKIVVGAGVSTCAPIVVP